MHRGDAGGSESGMRTLVKLPLFLVLGAAVIAAVFGGIAGVMWSVGSFVAYMFPQAPGRNPFEVGFWILWAALLVTGLTALGWMLVARYRGEL